MKRKPGNKDRITKTEKLPRRATKKLGQSKNINKYSKRSHKEAI